MTEEKMSPLRKRMIEDMRIHEMSDKRQKSHIRAIKDFAAFLGHSPDSATPEELCAYQLHMTDSDVTPTTFTLVGTLIGCIIIISGILSEKSLRFRVLITTCRLR